MGRPFRSPAPTARDAVQAADVPAPEPSFEPAPGQGAEPAAEEATEHTQFADAGAAPWEQVPSASVDEPLVSPESSDWLVTGVEAVGGWAEESRTVESDDASADPDPASTTGWDGWSDGSTAADTAAGTAGEQTTEPAVEPVVSEPGQHAAEAAPEFGGQLAEPPTSWSSDAMADLPGRGDEAWEIGAVDIP
ncbi:MAG TPA: hypothetical protein VHQ45_20250, partial [Gemmatimonadaceae bacterium]|nr:hypothetical protein [Gemmatimonadaceae bacterium]